MCGVALLALSALMRSLTLLLGLMTGEVISDPITRMRVPVFAKVTRLDLPPSEGGCNGLAAQSDDDILLPRAGNEVSEPLYDDVLCVMNVVCAFDLCART